MAWSEEMRCLHCDGKLPIYRKITNGQFCSAGHRKAYWKEQERLAVERLNQTHDSLRAYHPPAALEKHFEPAEENVVAESGRSLHSETTPQAEKIARTAANTDRVQTAGFVVSPGPQQGAAWSDHPRAVEAVPTAWAIGAPPIPNRAVERSSNEVSMAVRVELRLSNLNPFVPPMAAMASELAPAEMPPAVFTRMAFDARPDTPELAAALLPMLSEEPPVIEEPVIEAIAAAEEPQPQAAPFEIAPVETLFALPRIAGRDVEHVQMADALAALEMVLSAALVPHERRIDTPVLVTAGSHPLPLGNAVTAPGCAIENTAAVALESEAPKTELMLSTPSIEFNLHLAPGHRYVVRRQALAPVPAGQVEPAQPEVKLGTVPVALNRAVGLPMPNRAPAVPLNFRATVRKPRAARMMVPAEFAGPQFDDVKPMLPGCRENPLEGSLEPPPKRTLLSSWMQRSNGAHQKHVWTNAVDFWQHAPRDLKLVAVAIPVLLGLALHPSLPKVRVTASPRATNEIENGFTRNLRTQFVNVKRTVAERAGVALNEDFRSGLEEWQSRGERPTTWSFDTTGFVRPASLAVYRPSMVLTDYEMEFLGLIDKKALSWVVRAQDFDNFYVVKLVVLKPGPLPTIGLTRYAVVNGKAQDRVDKVLPVSVRPDMLYRVSMNVHGDTYLLALQGEIVDSWSEPRLTHGGIGFFAPRGEESRLRWVQVTHQYDMLGRLCAYLAPYNIPTNGSW